jgi:hypothetical protein
MHVHLRLSPVANIFEIKVDHSYEDATTANQMRRNVLNSG